MPDEDGFSVVGDLQVGSYASLEGDLGESLSGPLGFSAVEDEWEPVVEGFVSSPGLVRYVAVDQVESWGLFRWRTS